MSSPRPGMSRVPAFLWIGSGWHRFSVSLSNVLLSWLSACHFLSHRVVSAALCLVSALRDSSNQHQLTEGQSWGGLFLLF